MARIHALPSIEIIRGLKGILDFYVWRGLPCVRAWPRYRPARQTAASLAAALTFGAIVKAYALLANLALLAYREDALDQPRTARDIMVTGIFGNLHEASMSDFLDLLVQCRNFLSVLADPLQVRGQDQLFSFKGVLAHETHDAISGADGYVESPNPPSTEIWVVTHLWAVNNTTATTLHEYYQRHDAWNFRFHTKIAAFAPTHPSRWDGCLFMDHQDTILVYFKGGQVGDDVHITLSGYRMTLES